MKYFGDFYKYEDKEGNLLGYWKLGNTKFSEIFEHFDI